MVVEGDYSLSAGAVSRQGPETITVNQLWLNLFGWSSGGCRAICPDRHDELRRRWQQGWWGHVQPLKSGCPVVACGLEGETEKGVSLQG